MGDLSRLFFAICLEQSDTGYPDFFRVHNRLLEAFRYDIENSTFSSSWRVEKYLSGGQCQVRMNGMSRNNGVN